MRKYLHMFLANTSGQIAPIMAFAILPLISAVGLGVDYSYLAKMKTELQVQADVEALELRNGVWLSETVYQVAKKQDIPTFIMGVMGTSKVTIDVLAQVYVRPPAVRFIPPVFQSLEGDAAFDNKIGVYCYDPKTEIRSDFVLIADNRGTTHSTEGSTCKAGSELHYFLYTDLGDQRYLSLTDSGKKESFKSYSPFESAHITERRGNVESIVCDVLSQCVKPSCDDGMTDRACLNFKKDGGKIPEGSYREPMSELNHCAPGKYMYLGWDDIGYELWADKDYNDAVLVFSCPEVDVLNGKAVYLQK